LCPAITLDANRLHVVWYDERDGNDEIYYKRGTFPTQELTIDIILNDDSFVPDDTLTIDVQVDNPDPAITADVRICVKLPNDEYYRIIKLNDFPIPSGTLGPINLVNYTFTTNDLEGTYEAIGRLLHPDSGETLTEDIEPFEFVNP
jgi:DNA gyrase inhibitor GyrI